MTNHEANCQCPTCSPAGVEWETPQPLFDELNRVYGPFVLDVAATPENAKCPAFLSKANDALAIDWVEHLGKLPERLGAIWMNPPYGRGIGAWVRKARDVASMGIRVVCLLPVKTDTAWWHDYVVGPGAKADRAFPCPDGLSGYSVRFDAEDLVVSIVHHLRGRLNFGESAGPGRFASAVVVLEQA